ncbi:helix-turn-helix domain-containing protein, partial [Escherichia coli]|nr:helix-turn-helix domain-containing protein [Escherichia coli]
IWGETTNADGRTVARNRDRISVYLKGKTVPDPVNLQKLAEALGVDPADLAPDVIGAAVERENPELSMTVVAGHSDKVYLRVNKLLPLQYAVKIVNVVEEADRFAKGLIKPDKSE